MGKKKHPDDDVRLVPLDEVRLDGGTQTRVEGVDEDAAADFASAYRSAPDVMPPVDCVYDGTHYWLYDGFHRVCAASDAGLKEIRVRVVVGTLDHARLLAGGANKEHHAGRRTNKDKRRAVEVVFTSSESRGMSDVALARLCAVDPKTIAAVRRELSTSEFPKSRTGLDGRTIDTANIGKGKKPAPPADPDDIPFGPLEDDADQQAAENLIRMGAEGTLPTNAATTAEALRPTDGADLPVPDGMLDAFAARARFDECLKHLRAAQKLMHEIAAGPGGGHLRGELSHKSADGNGELRHYCEAVANAMRKLQYARPFACVCPYCLDEPKPDCKSCQGNGWVVRSCWKDAPEDFREAAVTLRQEAAS